MYLRLLSVRHRDCAARRRNRDSLRRHADHTRLRSVPQLHSHINTRSASARCTGGGVSAEGRNAPPSVRRRHRRRTHRRLGDGVSLICTRPRCTGAGAPERSQQVIAKSDSPMRIRRLFAVNRRGRCPHRPGRTHRFCGNLRRIRNFPAGRCGHRPLQTSG